MASESHWSLAELLQRQKTASKNYLEFLRRSDISAGLYSLAAGTKDYQQPHTEDEIYVVLSGKAKINIADVIHPAHVGDSIFVPANTPHYFFDIEKDLQVVVVFAPAEYSRRK